MKVIPNTTTLFNKIEMPLGLIIQPFHQLHETEGIVPIVDIFKDKIIRCDNCQT